MAETNSNGRNPTLRLDLRSMMRDGAGFSLMVGIGETYVPAFALALGLGETAAGLIATLPMLAGGLLQLISPWAVKRIGSHRRWVVACAACQAISMLLMLGLALATGITPWLVFLPATLYWAAGLATGPAWNAWVERLIPTTIRASFFAQRTRVSHIFVLLGVVAGGLILRGSTSVDTVRLFAVLFAIAASSRLFSAAMLARQSEPANENYADQSGVSYREALQGMGNGTGKKLLLYLLAVQVGVHIAGPFFTPFMLAELKLSYTQYMVLLGLGFLGKVVAMPWVGRFAKRAGAGRLLWIGGIGIVPLSAAWLVSNSMPYLMVLQVVGGVAWAGYELAMLLLFFETIPRERRVAMLSLFNAANAAAVVVGGLLGATVMQLLNADRTAYLAVFALSSVARLLALLLIPRSTPTASAGALVGLRTIAVRPMTGGFERPILPATAPEEGSS